MIGLRHGFALAEADRRIYAVCGLDHAGAGMLLVALTKLMCNPSATIVRGRALLWLVA